MHIAHSSSLLFNFGLAFAPIPTDVDKVQSFLEVLEGKKLFRRSRASVLRKNNHSSHAGVITPKLTTVAAMEFDRRKYDRTARTM